MLYLYTRGRKTFAVVLKGMPQVTTLNEIYEELTTKGAEVIDIEYLKIGNRRQGSHATKSHIINQKREQQINL